MKCINCGEEIDDSAAKCEFCGEIYDVPFVLDKDSVAKAKSYEKEVRKKEEEDRLKKKKEEKEKDIAENGAFYEKRSAYYISFGASILASLLMIASPFLKWGTVYMRRGEEVERRGFTLLDVTKSDGAVFYLIILLIVLLGVAMLYITLIDHKNVVGDKMKFLNNEPKLFTEFKYMSRITPFIAAVLLLLIFTNLKPYKTVLNDYKSVYASMESQIKTFREYMHYEPDMAASYGKGAGFYEYVFSIIIYLGTRVYKFVIDTLNEDE